MEFRVRNTGSYKEFTIKESGSSIVSNLLDENESLRLSSDIFIAAWDLVGEEAFKLLIKEHFKQEDLFEDDK